MNRKDINYKKIDKLLHKAIDSIIDARDELKSHALKRGTNDHMLLTVQAECLEILRKAIEDDNCVQEAIVAR